MNCSSFGPINLLLVFFCFYCCIGQILARHSSSSESDQNCLVYDSSDGSNPSRHSRIKRITNGLAGSIERMPWMVFLSTNFQLNGLLRVTNCTGSLVSPRHVLTNGHCISVLHMLNNNTISLSLGSANKSAGHLIVRDKYAAHIHPNFTTYVLGSNVYTRFDMAIVDLGQELEFNDHLHSICTLCLDQAYPQGDATIAGWGNMASCNNNKTSVYPDIFRYDVVGIHSCLTPEFTKNNKVCTQADSNHGIGGGDSGGAVLASRNNTNNGRLYQVGVNGGNNCAANERENAFDKIDGQWLEQITGVKCKKYTDCD